MPYVRKVTDAFAAPVLVDPAHNTVRMRVHQRSRKILAGDRLHMERDGSVRRMGDRYAGKLPVSGTAYSPEINGECMVHMAPLRWHLAADPQPAESKAMEAYRLFERVVIVMDDTGDGTYRDMMTDGLDVLWNMLSREERDALSARVM